MDRIITPPYNNEIEQALLSILLYDNQQIEFIPEIFSKEHFYEPLHGKIFAAIWHMAKQNYVANPITLSQYFNDDPKENAYLAELGALLAPPRNAADYAKQVYDLYIRRRLIMLGQDIADEASTCTIAGATPSEQIESIEKKLFDLGHDGQERHAQPFCDALASAITAAESAYKNDSHVVGVTTGFIAMDKLLGGLYPSDLLILAGRPSMGKTAFATNIAFNAAKAKLKGEKGGGANVAFFSLEMSATQLAMRILGQETGVSSDKIRRGAIEQKHLPMFVDVAREFSKLPLFIDDTPALSIAALRSRARRLMRREGLGLIIVDYLQLLTTGGRSHSDNRVQELSEITRGLKAIAKELNVPVLALSQLSRAVEQREDKRPQLSDLRESGTIEQDSDVVMFVYREEYYESRKKPTEGSEKMASWQKSMSSMHNLAEIIVAKQRHGPIATVQMHFDGQRTRFSNLIKEVPSMASVANL